VNIGILGVGELASFLVEGLRRACHDDAIVLSPRNRERSKSLAERHGCTVAADNADLVERSDIVVLATRPPQAIDAVRGLPWRDEHVLLSAAPGVALAPLRSAAAPATVVRALPVSCAAIGESPSALFPDEPRARELLGRLGSVHVFPDEASFEVAVSVGVYYAWTFALAAEGTRWAQAHGVAPDAARAFVVESLRGAANMMAVHPEEPLADMLDALATPGGLTRLGLGVMEERGALAAWSAACDAVLARVRETSD
jgi:pyrroline-5-carboxylate reductase